MRTSITKQLLGALVLLVILQVYVIFWYSSQADIELERRPLVLRLQETQRMESKLFWELWGVRAELEIELAEVDRLAWKLQSRISDKNELQRAISVAQSSLYGAKAQDDQKKALLLRECQEEISALQYAEKEQKHAQTQLKQHLAELHYDLLVKEALLQSLIAQVTS
eukprot:Rmarinus@m.18257